MARLDEQPEQYGVAPVAGYARRTPINPVGKGERGDPPDGLLGGRRHGGRNRSISEIPVKATSRPFGPKGALAPATGLYTREALSMRRLCFKAVSNDVQQCNGTVWIRVVVQFKE